MSSIVQSRDGNKGLREEFRFRERLKQRRERWRSKIVGSIFG